ncbi:cutinase family protein [Corynebacterium breve]|uniref:Cutinase family protein n=1 Tax=Corynebacterium breve TaxID=3049799 RepID=A0ABY8VC14_9CORY|nr:cutinase family protein [Corynebacterium breve]WIM67018.1 cutinase family protein [Corynebacterium breve]
MAFLVSDPVAGAADESSVSTLCKPVHVLQAAGTGESRRDHTPIAQEVFANGWNPALELENSLGEENIGSFNISYPASLGAISVLAGDEFGYEMSTFGESVLAGEQVATQEITAVHAACPHTKYILVGYSQGSSVVGNVAANIAAGTVADVHPDDIAAVLLVADPGRSLVDDSPTPSPSVVYGPIPPGVVGQNQEIINGGGTQVLPERVGMTGPRGQSFDGLHGKVFSLCHENDMACSSLQDSVVLAIADHAGRIENPGPGDVETGPILQAFFDEVNAGTPIGKAARNAGLTHRQVLALIDMALEVREFAGLAYSHSGGGLTRAQFLAITAIAALPHLAHEGVTAEYLGPVLTGIADQIRDVAPNAASRIYSEVRTLCAIDEGLVPNAESLKVSRQERAFNAVEAAGEGVARATGLDRIMESPDHANLVHSAALAGGFGPSHMTYYRGGYSINGLSGQDYGEQWLKDVAAAVIAGESRTLGSPTEI